MEEYAVKRPVTRPPILRVRLCVKLYPSAGLSVIEAARQLVFATAVTSCLSCTHPITA